MTMELKQRLVRDAMTVVGMALDSQMAETFIVRRAVFVDGTIVDDPHAEVSEAQLVTSCLQVGEPEDPDAPSASPAEIEAALPKARIEHARELGERN